MSTELADAVSAHLAAGTDATASALSAAIRAHLSFVPPGAVDRAAGVVRGVRVLGPRGRKGYKYPPAVTARYAHLYAVPVAVGHHTDPTTGAPLEVPDGDRFGRLLNPRPHAGGVNADLHIDLGHPLAERFLWAAENEPWRYSLSALHKVALLPDLDADGDWVAERVLGVQSVDVVERGDATSTLFL